MSERRRSPRNKLTLNEIPTVGSRWVRSDRVYSEKRVVEVTMINGEGDEAFVVYKELTGAKYRRCKQVIAAMERFRDPSCFVPEPKSSPGAIEIPIGVLAWLRAQLDAGEHLEDLLCQ